jgi:uncharacterized SAM-binding protein YcdF (DUF218 family)
VLYGVLAVIPAVLFAFGFKRDPRSVRNAVWLGLLLVLLGLWAIATASGPLADVIGFAVLAVVLGVGLVLPLALIGNGVVMVRREGRRLANLLSLLAGVAIIAVDAVFLIALRSGFDWVGALAGAVVILSAYAGFILVSLLVYAFVYGRLGRVGGYESVIVCGAGLVKGAVSPLLAGRLDRAAAVFRGEGESPLLVVSGGQGPDEPRSEAEAMREYLVDAGVPDAAIALEDQARTTEENLRLGTEVAREQGRPGRAMAVTSNYHALRTAVLARDLGLPIDVVGSRTALYFLPSAFLREVVAIIVRRWRAHAIACAALLAGYGLLLYWAAS